jgi:hypothetical protein
MEDFEIIYKWFLEQNNYKNKSLWNQCLMLTYKGCLYRYTPLYKAFVKVYNDIEEFYDDENGKLLIKHIYKNTYCYQIKEYKNDK